MRIRPRKEPPMHSDYLNPDVRKKLEWLAGSLERGQYNVSEVVKELRTIIASPTPSPQSARERLLAVLPKWDEEPMNIGDLIIAAKFTVGDDFWDVVSPLTRSGEVDMFSEHDLPISFRLAPPVEGVDLEELAERLHNYSGLNWHAKTESTKDEWRGIAKTAITALRRTPALDVSEVERVMKAMDGLQPRALARQLSVSLYHWLATRPKAAPVNAELLEAARALHKHGIEIGYSFEFPTQLRLINATARADAASTNCATSPTGGQPNSERCGSERGSGGETPPDSVTPRRDGDFSSKPDPAARPAAEPWVRELGARMIEYPGGMRELAAAIRRGDCDPKPGK